MNSRLDLKIPKGAAIRCYDSDELNKVCNLLDSLGAKWVNSTPFNKVADYIQDRCPVYIFPYSGTWDINCSKYRYIVLAEEYLSRFKMESRSITLTLEKAKEWYNSGNEALKEAALQAYTKEELVTPEWQNIKTFKDACKALGIESANDAFFKLPYSVGIVADHLYAVYKLDIIRKALNKGWKPDIKYGTIYYPYITIYPASTINKLQITENLGKSFIANGERYTLVVGDQLKYDGGLAGFNFGAGTIACYLGILGCKSKEIAEHMSRYFSKEIFEAVYAQHVGMYQWV